MILTVEGRTFPVDIFYLQRFDSPCIFSEGDWKTRPVWWAEKQLRLLTASRAVRQAAEEGHVLSLMGCSGTLPQYRCRILSLPPDVQVSMTLWSLAQLQRAK